MINVLAALAIVFLMALISVGLAILTVIRRDHTASLIALKGLTDTHLMGYEALVLDIDKLKERVEHLEWRFTPGGQELTYPHKTTNSGTVNKENPHA